MTEEIETLRPEQTAILRSAEEGEKLYQDFIDTQIAEPKLVVEEIGKKGLPRILLLYTGGTLGMKFETDSEGEQVKVPKLSLEELLNKTNMIAGLKDRYNILGYHISNIDSTAVNIKVWDNIAKVIHEHYEDVDGTVVLHGTDTMAYSAAATAFTFRNTSIPIIYTGAQKLLEEDGSDVISNLTGAFALASPQSRLSEVGLYFDGKIFRGTRVDKKDDSRLDGFGSDIFGPIGYFGANGIELDKRAVLRGTHAPSELIYHPEFGTSVMK